jgi:cellulose synthase/poly-beta-1,6-N-acetylglucosamine synthase-like glycosyltransferase
VHPIIELVLTVLAVPALGSSLYLLLLTLLSAKLQPAPASSRQMRFDVIVPAHDEVAVLSRVLGTLSRLDWPRDRFNIVVVADNCTDDTAALARSLGAAVMERHDPERRGKGYALEFAFKASRARGFADAVVVVDADAEVSANLLEAVAARMERGAEAVQVHYGVSNASVSWRTRLLTIAKASFHIVRSRARERLRLSCGIRGNGWAVTHRLLDSVPYHSFSLTEDLEYGIELGLLGHRVLYAEEASSDAEMVSNERAARKQRQRWEQGRFQLVRSQTLPLLRQAVRRRSRVCLDLAIDLLVLPLSYVALSVALLTALAVAGAMWHACGPGWLWLSLFCWAALAAHILRGWQLSGVGPRGLIDLARAPLFLVWKLAVMLSRQQTAGWTRTTREEPRQN